MALVTAFLQRGKEVDIWRSEIKVLVKKRIWEWEVRHLDTPIVARPRVQSESGVNHARTRLKPTSTLDVDSNSAFSEASKYPTTGRHKRTTSDVGVSKVRGSAHEHSSRPRSHSPSNRVRLDPDQLEPAKMAPNNSSSLDVPALRSHLTRLSVQPLVTTIPGPGDKGPNELASNGSHPIPNINTPAVPTLVLTEPTGEQSPESRTNSEASSIETPDGEITFPAIQHHNESNNESNSQLPGIDKARPRAVSATIPHWRVDCPPTLGNKPRGPLLGPRPGSCPPAPVQSGTKESLENSSGPLFKTAPVGSFDETPTANSLHTSDYFTAPTGFEIALVDELDILSDPEHPESIARLEEGALSYLQAEDFEKATEMFKVVLDLRRRIQGDSHLFTIQTMSNLALGYEGQGEFDQAIGILRETLTELNNSHSSVNVVFRSPIEERLVELHARQAEFAGSMTIVRRTSRGAKRTNSVDQIATRVHSDKSLPFHIDSNTSPETIMAHLTNRRCPDLTHLIDIKQCSAVPVSEGGYGDIWKGMLVGQRPVAMKSLRVNNGRGKLNKRLAQELYAWSKADHENVLKLLGLAYYKDSIVMVSPWMQYGSINAYLEQHPETNRLHIAIQIADGIAHLHRIGMVHGDLKAVCELVVATDGF